MAHGDAGRGDGIGDTEPGQVALHRRIQFHLARLNQLHDRQRREGFAHRGENERSVRGDRSPALVGRPEATQMHDLVVMDQAQRQAGNVIGLHLFTHIRIDPGQIRSASMRRSGDGKCRQRHYYEQKRTEEDIT